jgi:CheY-like chemotaxis protein
MQLLIVHRDAEVGEQLVQMVQEYTEHDCAYADSGAAALAWARNAPRCSLLITQLDADGINGLSLAGTISEMFAGMQTMFLPDYAATEQRVELPRTKVFPEPIDGQLLLDAIELAEGQRQIGLDLYHALDVIQMCCLSFRSGAIQLVRRDEAAVVFLRSGNIVHSEFQTQQGADALTVIAAWDAVEFAYDYVMRAPVDTITLPWDEAIAAAVAAASPAKSRPSVSQQTAQTAKRGLFGSVRKTLSLLS